MQKHPLSFHLIRITALLLTAYVLFGAAGEVNRVAWGTGDWLGQYSLKWGIGFFLFLLLCLALFLLALLAAYTPQKLSRSIPLGPVTNYQLPNLLRWPLILALLLAPVWFFQYTTWGIIFTSASFRLLIWSLTTLAIAYLLTPSSYPVTRNSYLLAALLLTGAAFAIAPPLVNVTSYPFSLEWSEGNRLWDYSTMFGRGLYNYPADQPLVPFLDFGRTLIGGLPFLLPHVTIAGERLWVALVAIVPYLLLGWTAFSATGVKRSHIFLAGLWTFLFLRQGPIHPPLVLSAILVALTWRRSLWISLPAIAVASWFAAVSRFTWMFAPGMWAGMLVLADEMVSARPAGPSARSVGQIANLSHISPSARTWAKAILLGLVGAASGYLLPQVDFIQSQGVFEASSNALTGQSLLWYRLLPNSTYDLGIIVNLLLAVAPVIAVMIYLAARGDWKLSLWQKLVIVLPLLAFLGVGLIASAKIGGGADLHNMDMFLIGVMFAASLAWSRLVPRLQMTPALVTGLLVMAFLPSFGALRAMTPLLHADELDRLKVLTGREDIVRNDPNLLGFLPSEEKTQRALNGLRAEVEAASRTGEVLFMDQRQLLTFGFIPNIPLVPEYDKKYLMDRAMNDSLGPVFQDFYADLAAHRFALIVSDPLRKPAKGSEYSFGEENDAWVKWVAAPILCYYTVKADLEDFRIQLLVPRAGSVDCALPQ
ncbi:MAG: hypothetical protein AB1750_07120 [Chloroflexota bacterium]